MPKLKPDTQRARQENILDAAERCFARSGFHRTTMQDICKEAGVSPGSIYVYFKSKEALIEGLCDRDRSMLADNLEQFVEAPDLMAALQKLGEHYAVEQPRHKQLMHVEIGVESTRNKEVGRMYRSVDEFCLGSFERIFARAEADGKIAPTLDVKTIAKIVALIGDGMFWRRAVDPDFDAKPLLPILTQMVSTLLEPTGSQPNEVAPPEVSPPAPNATPARSATAIKNQDRRRTTSKHKKKDENGVKV